MVTLAGIRLTAAEMVTMAGIRLAGAEMVALAGIRLAVGGMVTLAAVFQHKEFSQGQEQMGFLSHQLGPMV